MNILNPIAQQSIALAPDGTLEIVNIPGTVTQIPPNIETIIKISAGGTGDAGFQIAATGTLFVNSLYIPLVFPGLWFPNPGEWFTVESHIIVNNNWTLTDVTFHIEAYAANLLGCTLLLKDFKVIIPSKPDYLPIIGVG